MENAALTSTYKSEYLNPSTGRPQFMGSGPPGQRPGLERYFRKAGRRLLKQYHNDKIQAIMLPVRYNESLVRSTETSDPLEDMRVTRKRYLIESCAPAKVMPRLYPEGKGKRMEDFYTIFNLQREYFKDYTKELPRYSYFKMGGHPFTQAGDTLMDFSSSHPRKMYQSEKYFLSRNLERQGPPLPGDYSLAGYRDSTTTAFKY